MYSLYRKESILNISRKVISNNFELCEFDYSDDLLRDMILVHYIRQKKYNIDSNILVISDDKSYRQFKTRISNVINGFNFKNLNCYKYRNGIIMRFLDESSFTLDDLKYIQENLLKKFVRSGNRNTKFYDIIILYDSVSFKYLRKIVFSYVNKKFCEDHLLKTLFIYLFHYTRYQRFYYYFG